MCLALSPRPKPKVSTLLHHKKDHYLTVKTVVNESEYPLAITAYRLFAFSKMKAVRKLQPALR
jgi:hypothetical protein